MLTESKRELGFITTQTQVEMPVNKACIKGKHHNCRKENRKPVPWVIDQQKIWKKQGSLSQTWALKAANVNPGCLTEAKENIEGSFLCMFFPSESIISKLSSQKKEIQPKAFKNPNITKPKRGRERRDAHICYF